MRLMECDVRLNKIISGASVALVLQKVAKNRLKYTYY